MDAGRAPGLQQAADFCHCAAGGDHIIYQQDMATLYRHFKAESIVQIMTTRSRSKQMLRTTLAYPADTFTIFALQPVRQRLCQQSRLIVTPLPGALMMQWHTEYQIEHNVWIDAALC